MNRVRELDEVTVHIGAYRGFGGELHHAIAYCWVIDH